MKKPERFTAIILAILLLCVGLVGCGGKKESASEVVGVWVSDGGYEKTTLSITADSKITLSASYMGKEYPFLEGTYTLDGTLMTVTYGETTETTEFSVSDGVLSITLLKTDFVLNRQ